MAMRLLKPVQGNTVPDRTGKNPGNLTTEFATGTVGMPGANVYEIYHMVVSGGPPLGQANIVIGGQLWSTVTLDGFGTNEWDPQQPAKMISDQEMYFLWAIPAPGTPGQIPAVTMWPQWDPELPENKGLHL